MTLADYQAAKAADSRQRITKAATRLFLANSYDRVSVAEVTKQADVSLRTLYKHFDSKAALYASVVVAKAEELTDDLSASIDDEAPALAAVAAFALRVMQIGTRDDVLALWRTIIMEGRRFPQILDAYLQAREEFTALVRDFLQRLEARGDLRLDDRDAAVTLFIGMLDYRSSLPALIGEPGLDAAGQTRLAHQVAEAVLARFGAAGGRSAG
ncbi:TetR family transcriptional regulator [Rhodothalassium salexigens DSM 2132]|uniref:TetR family transcriptional regulator n=1 Tax=Rhodothalassium salexigens DSM 2132 TaxID=1188247 RepID=A0A4R2PHC9_RHOSA|nr:TetR/AcrR family transcriptional regulator [Rhodothalassium salexigens]MBB4211764.1 AcrR family transcriptional regulator [Rhodothalassium salexigens DSM 2132]MBK1639629.1 hypothetical protein [Rhodothalassium salexigens DSM 2132]TCP33938.1 TetR family transcriptional regulator [Rhodothalassium salexigens DSM 2132]